MRFSGPKISGHIRKTRRDDEGHKVLILSGDWRLVINADRYFDHSIERERVISRLFWGKYDNTEMECH